MDPGYLHFLKSSFDEYLRVLDTDLEPNDSYLSYEYPFVVGRKWRFLSDSMIKDELRELTNRLHDWRDLLRRWQAWNRVSKTKSLDEAWDLRREFMEPLMNTCLLMPSTARDVFTFVSTNAFHQIRLNSETEYVDTMDGDPTAAMPKPRPLTRRQKESRLLGILKPLAGSGSFISALRRIDDSSYRTATKDYRNLNSHAIGPRIALGYTKMVTLSVSPAMRMEAQEDGTSRLVAVPGRYCASYSFGGLEPLDQEAARAANLDQYRAARVCFERLVSLLEQHCASVTRADA
jgi:hypothetical protein